MNLSEKYRDCARLRDFQRVSAGQRAAAIQRRAERHMPGNPFPPDSPWGRELDRLYAQDRAAERFDREVKRTGQGRAA